MDGGAASRIRRPGSSAAILSHLRRLVSTMLALGARGLEAAAKFGLYALAARLLGSHDSGRFFLCLSLLHFLSTFARLGLERPITRHVAAELAVRRGDLARRAALRGGAGILAASVATGLLVVAAAPAAAAFFHQPDLVGPLRLLGGLVPLNNLAFTAAYVLMGLDRGVLAQLLANAAPPALALAALLAGASSTSTLLAAYGAAFTLCGAAGLAAAGLSWNTPKSSLEADADIRDLQPLWASARPLFVFELGQAFLLSLPVLALGRYATPLAVSEFSIATRLSMLVATIVLSLGQLLAPTVARHHRRREAALMQAAYRRARFIVTAVCAPILLALVVAGPQLLRLLGSESASSVWTLRLLVAGQTLYCAFPFVEVLLSMTGNGDVMRRLMIVQLAVCIALALALVPIFGMLGAAVVSLAQWMIVPLGGAWAVRRRLPELRTARVQTS